MIKNISRTVFVTGSALAVVALGSQPAQASSKPIKNLEVTTFTIDKGTCKNGYLQAWFEAPHRNTVLYDLTVKTSRGKVFEPAYSYDSSVSIDGGCVSKGFVDDVKRKRLTGTVRAFTGDGDYVGQRTVRIKLVDNWGC
ncbi:hypothetical protein GCM10009828_104000 [Actinoplanes couchii]|uniref:Uncharacterized protein n=2 Tax=Actinoplanes couchii TaxID=403638 RepID=A0ABQ3XLJ5_9ACTN|nr:hypothetical protein Aco03nite_077060 [Actinoplanes couchii]